MSTALQLVQQAAGEMGLPSPTYLVGNNVQTYIQLLALANGLGNELVRKHPWQKMGVEYRVTTSFYSYTGTTTLGSTSITAMSSIVGLDATYMITGTGIANDTYVVSAASSTVVMSQAATASGTVTLTFSKTKYAMPSDFDRLVDRTDWDKSQHWEMLGPETAQQWQWLKSGFISTGPRVRYRPFQGYFQTWPALGAAHVIGFEYISKNWALASTDTTASKTSFTVDTDTCIWSDRLMVTGIKWRYFQIKGFAADALEQDFNTQLELEKSNDSGSPTLSLAPRIANILIGWENIPDSSYGS